MSSGIGDQGARVSSGLDDHGGDLRLPTERLADFAADVLLRAGLASTDAKTAADLIVEADLIGARTHGVIRLPQYVAALRAQHVNRDAQIRLVSRSGSTALVDGDNGMGHLCAAFAARTAVEIAEVSGVGWVGIRGSNHAGAGGVYAAIPVAHGMIGLYAAVSGANHMPVSGGAEPLLGTNPIAIAVPAVDAPVVLDIATSVASSGAIKSHALAGIPIPEGWLVSRVNGEPITDPARASEGLLQPMGGHKGSGLALMIGLLAGVLNGAAFGRDIRDFARGAPGPSNTGQLIVALDVQRFMPIDRFKTEVDRHMQALRGSTPLPGHESVRLPGDRRQHLRQTQLQNGVEVGSAVAARLNELASDLGLAPLSPR